MKIFAILCIFIMLSMTLIPLLAYEKKDKDKIIGMEEYTFENESHAEKNQSSYGENYKDISVYIASKDVIEDLNMRDYLIGAVAAEMPASYHEEALKAQALTCFTYAVRIMEEEKSKPTKALKGADLSSDSNIHQAYMNKEELKDRWGSDFDKFYEKISNAVDAVANKIIVYENKPIVAVFHAISSGKTEKAENIWSGSQYPYLDSAKSEGDVLSPQFSTTSILTEKQFAEIANKVQGLSLSGEASEWIGESKISDSGTVLSIEIGNKTLTGTEVREYFSLRSPNFLLKHSDDGTFSFSVSGYGHGVGMSQYGADYMARQGENYQEIIKHYYKGVDIIDMGG